MDTIPPGSKMTPKALIIICYVELGKPYTFLARGINSVRGRNSAEGKGYG
jgi:hypothetical protein